MKIKEEYNFYCRVNEKSDVILRTYGG